MQFLKSFKIRILFSANFTNPKKKQEFYFCKLWKDKKTRIHFFNANLSKWWGLECDITIAHHDRAVAQSPNCCTCGKCEWVSTITVAKILTICGINQIDFNHFQTSKRRFIWILSTCEGEEVGVREGNNFLRVSGISKAPPRQNGSLCLFSKNN